MSNDLLLQLKNMSVEEVKKQIEQLIITTTEQDAFNKGKEMVDKLYEMNNISSSRVAWAVVFYALLKAKCTK